MASVTRNSSDENRADPNQAGGGNGGGGAKPKSADLPDEVDDGGADERTSTTGGGGAKAFKSGKDKGGAEAAAPERKDGRSYFTIYKKGQGYWVRMGTLIATSVLGLMLAYTLYDKIPAIFAQTRGATAQVTTPATAAEAQALLAEAQQDIGAKRYDDAQARLNAVSQAAKDGSKGIPVEVAQQADSVRRQIPDPAARGRRLGIIVAGAFLLLYVPLVLHLINKPANVDFLIATDSEMKKVNWTSRRELIGSTKVVIVFMFLISILLFVIDIAFGYLMYLVGVLRHPLSGIGGG